MREITKIVTLPVEEKRMEFRLTKLDAFSGASLLRLLRRHVDLKSGAERAADTIIDEVFSALSEEELRSLMVTCLNHTEVRLDAGFQRIMEGPDWGWPELSHDAGTCLRLTLQSVLWTLQGFFPAGGPPSTPARPGS